MTTDSSHPPAPKEERPEATSGPDGDPIPAGDPPGDDGRPTADPKANAAGAQARVAPTMLGSQAVGGWSLELPEFEGPLDLLLHLVRRHELDILDIPIAFVTKRYLEYLSFMRALDLEVAGDYLVMAATLAYLKSRELVPSEPAEDDAEGASDLDGPDPREELIARLLEYQKFRAAASDLDRLPISGRDVFARGGAVELPPFDPGLAPITLFRLAEAYHRVLDRARIHKSHEVVLEEVSVSRRMEQLTLLLIDQPKIDFESLFLDRTWSSEDELRSMLVVTLMSILELTRLGVIHVHQPSGAETILIERKATPEEARRAISGYDEEASFGEVAPPGEVPGDSEDASLGPQTPDPGAEGSSAGGVDAANAESETVAPESGSGEPPDAGAPASPPAQPASTDSDPAASEDAPLPDAETGVLRDPPDSDA